MSSPVLLRPPGPPVASEPALVRVDDARFEAVVSGARLTTLYDRAIWAEGPTWWAARDMLVFSDVRGRRLLGWREDGAVEVLVDVTPFGNGNAVDPQGRLVHCEHGHRAVTRTESDGRRTVLADRVDGRRLNTPNDLAIGPEGRLWFTDPTFGLLDPREGYPAQPEFDVMGLYRIDPEGLWLAAEFDYPNGLAFAPDGSRLYVSQTPPGGEAGIIAFDVTARGLTNRRWFATVPSGIPDGFTVDRRGWVWTSSGEGIWVFDEAGTRLGLVATPHLTSNCVFDPTWRRLFVTGDDSLWLIDLPHA